ncbi:MAG: carboxypeptidase-like regulatory domain-containing protein, partial [Bacteroidaceae bacterium]|nr:carboxypeptidase-like regulatory domain-containing protein [Bacteroidaceae bacterium]
MSLVLCVAALLSAAQNTTLVRGLVLDSISNEPLPNVSVMLGETGMGTMTDTNGSFEIKSQSDFSQVTFSTLGYKSQSAHIKSGRNNKLHIALSPMYIPLEEVLVEPSKEKYSKKNNPAVDLARRLIAMRAQQDSLAPAYFSQQKYRKTTYAINNFDHFAQSNLLAQLLPFLVQYKDTSDVTHRTILNLILNEQLVDCCIRHNPFSVRETVIGTRSVGLEGFFDKENLQSLSDEMFREVDIYSNDITLFDQQFVSPLSQHAISFYKYYLLDTLDVEGERCIDLGFAAYNPQAMGFAGHLY